VGVVRIAPRYEARLVRVLYALDDRSVPIAQVCRDVGQVAEALGAIRPSYVHVRRLLVAERDRVDAVQAFAEMLLERIAATSTRSRDGRA
jgi:hypothetical protein